MSCFDANLHIGKFSCVDAAKGHNNYRLYQEYQLRKFLEKDIYGLHKKLKGI